MSTELSDPINTVPSRKEYAWWLDNIDHRISPEFRRLLEDYSGIPPDKVRQHIYDIREKAWEIRPYPCIGLGRFLDNLLARSPQYKNIISRLQNGESFLDVGCFMGQEMRQLVADGAPIDRLYAIDIVNYMDLGYEFFRDENKFKINYMQEDIVNPADGLKALQGKMDIILVNQVFHQWHLETQIDAANELVKLSRPGSLILGYSAGAPEPRELHGPKGSKYRSLVHNPDTWKQLWDLVGRATNTKWKSEARLLTWEELGHNPDETAYMGRDMLMLEFVLTREE